MQLEVKIDSEAVQQQVVQAIMNSAIGNQIEVAVKEALSKGNSWNQPSIVQHAVNEVLRKTIAQIAHDLVETRREQIKAQMAERLTDEVFGKMIDAAWGVMNGRLSAQ